MKHVSVLVFCIGSLAVGCGGQTEDGSHRVASSVGGNTPIPSTGGSTSVDALGTGGDLPFVTGGSASVINATGGSVSSTTGGETSVNATGGSNSTGGFTSSTGGAMQGSNLSIRLADSTPKSHIVVGAIGTADIQTYSEYIVKNNGTTDQNGLMVFPSGTTADFAGIQINACNGREGPGIYAANAFPMDGSGFDATKHMKPNSNLGGIGDPSFVVPAGGELHLCVNGIVAQLDANAAPGEGPRSGDEVSLQINDITDFNGNHAVVEGSLEPPKMLLRKSAPIIAPVIGGEPLHEGLNTFTFLVSSASSVNPVAIEQMIFTVSASSEIQVDAANDGFVWVNGTSVPNAKLASHVTGMFYFHDGADHLATSASPMKVEFRFNVTGVQTGSRLAILFASNSAASNVLSGYFLLQGPMVPGYYLGQSASSLGGPDTWLSSSLFWSDLSVDGHVPLGSSAQSIGDYLSGYLVDGADGAYFLQVE
jgi:hypothetical protein